MYSGGVNGDREALVGGAERDGRVRAWTRFLAASAAWAMLLAGQPGLGRPEGFGHWAFVALVPWGLVCSRPGRRAFLAEWAAASLGLMGWAAWMRYLLPQFVPPMGMVPALYVAAAGVLLRHLARRYPLALAVPIAWMAGELVRWHLTSLSFGWWRLGTMAHASEWMVGSTRVWGVWGLSYVFAAFGGWIADLLALRQLAPGESARHSLRTIHLCGLGPLALCVGICIFVRPPLTEDGPRVMVVQPGIEQELKSGARDRFADIYADMCALTHEGLEAAEEEGEPAVDLVAWGETMFPWRLVEPGVLDAFDAGARFPSWARRAELTRESLEILLSYEQALVAEVFFDPERVGRREGLVEALQALDHPWARDVLAGRPLLPAGASFLYGVHAYFARDGEIRSRNAAVLWDAGATRHGPVAKVHLVPGAEDPRVFLGVGFFFDLILEVGGYVPDFVADPEAGVLPLELRDGRRYAMGVSICYDNAFDDPYTAPLRREAVDFHVVLSNEAWYERSVEMDHMMAFTRLVAAMTGRSVLRVTNSGISAVVGPDGRVLSELADARGSKMARGVLRATVPVPVRDGAGRAPRTLFVLTERVQLLLWWALILASAWAARPRGSGYSAGGGR